MNLFTKIDIPASACQIDYKSRIAFFGSCFADNISAQFASRKVNVLANPFGTVYNPLSIAKQIKAIADRKVFGEDDVFRDMRVANGECTNNEDHVSNENCAATWYSWDAHGSLSGKTKEECIAKLNNAATLAREFLQKSDVVFITLGTSFVYFLKDIGAAVSNCHQQNPNLFIRKMISVDHVVAALKSIVQDLQKIKNDMRIVFTVSPLRHMSDGAHGNTLSKATLQLAIEKVIQEIAPSMVRKVVGAECDRNALISVAEANQSCTLCNDVGAERGGNVHISIAEANQSCAPRNDVGIPTPTISYFPSYEIVMDELRDYRFYDSDMVHLSKTAEEYIFERMTEVYCDGKIRDNIKQVEKFLKMAKHRIQDEHSPATVEFRQRILEEATKLEKQIPGLTLNM